MCVDAQLVIVNCDDYEWLYVNGIYTESGHTIPQHVMLRVINTFELDGSYAKYEVNQNYVDENGGDLPDFFHKIPKEKLSLIKAAPKR